MTILYIDAKRGAAVTDDNRGPAPCTKYADLEVGDVVNGRWTIERVTVGEAVVAALGRNGRGERFSLTGEPRKRVRAEITRG